MFIWLQGPSGAGKSTTGRILSELRGVGFVDVDRLVEERSGLSVAEIFATAGEREFRRLEQDAIRSCIENFTEHRVVALGAGALGDEDTRRRIEATGLRFFLDVDPETAISRLVSGEPRPMLDREDHGAAWRELYRARLDLYNDCDLRVDTTGRAPVDIATELSQAEDRLLEPVWSRSWRLAEETTTVSIYQSVFALMLALDDLLRDGNNCTISDRNVARIYSEHLNPVHGPRRLLCEIDPGEEGKQLPGVEAIARDLVRHGVSRDGVVIGIGGGVVSDLAGFVASIYMRGVDSITVPTTLLGQVDAAIGGKTAVNAAGIRNLLGSYKQPRHILISPGFLKTLPPRELRSGIIEALKIGIIHEPALVEEITPVLEAILNGEIPERIIDIIRLAVETKFRIVEQDIHDSSVRLSLNFGHTFGHAIEAAEPGRFTHGEAVAIGMIAATEMARALGRISQARRESLVSSIVPLAPVVEGDHDFDAILDAMRGDKKRAENSIRFILPGESGGFTVDPIDDPAVVIQSLERAFESISHFQEKSR